MSKKNINVVLSGKFANMPIKKSETSKYAYVPGGSYIVKNRVKSINMVNQAGTTSYGKALTGTALFGTGGAALGTNIQEMLLEINWYTGDKSLVKVNKEMYEAMTVGMYDNLSEEKLREITEKDEKDRANAPLHFIVGLIVIVGVFMLLSRMS